MAALSGEALREDLKNKPMIDRVQIDYIIRITSRKVYMSPHTQRAIQSFIPDLAGC
jgi:hypothetical protein